MAKKRIGKLPPRYSFILNTYPDARLSKCPCCQRLTHMRKFAFLIHIRGWGLLVLGKTCRYCTPCELIMLHQDELEAELANSFEAAAPEVIGNEYLVLGTVEKRVWREGLEKEGTELKKTLDHFAEFRKVLDLKIEPGGWYPAELMPKRR